MYRAVEFASFVRLFRVIAGDTQTLEAGSVPYIKCNIYPNIPFFAMVNMSMCPSGLRRAIRNRLLQDSQVRILPSTIFLFSLQPAQPNSWSLGILLSLSTKKACSSQQKKFPFQGRWGRMDEVLAEGATRIGGSKLIRNLIHQSVSHPPVT